MTHVSNILGTIYPIREIAQLVHEHDAQLCVDGVAYAPHREVNVQALEADFYGFSFYKTYGPHHAVLYGTEEALRAVGNANHYFFGNDQIPGKLEPGNANYELSWGTVGIVDYLEELGAIVEQDAVDRAARTAAWSAIANHEQALAAPLLDYLGQRQDVRVIGQQAAEQSTRVPTISFVHDQLKSSDIVTKVDKDGLGIRYGHFYALRLIERLGLLERDGVVRVSLVHYNTSDEVERLLDALERAMAS